MHKFCRGHGQVRVLREVNKMRNEFTAIIERDGPWHIAYCLEIPGANGQGKSTQEAIVSLSEAIALILEDRREDGLRESR
jgi:predicted RNase H-like HicB family nuclease